MQKFEAVALWIEGDDAEVARMVRDKGGDLANCSRQIVRNWRQGGESPKYEAAILDACRERFSGRMVKWVQVQQVVLPANAV